MTDLLAQQLALYPFTKLADDYHVVFASNNNWPELQLHKAANLLQTWSAPLRWGAVLDYLANQHAIPAVLAPIQLTQNLMFDPDQMLLVRAGEIIRLTDKEQATLLYLYQAQRPVTREELVEKVWEYHADVQTHTVETLIWRLRQKLETNPETPQLLVTTPQGYALKTI